MIMKSNHVYWGKDDCFEKLYSPKLFSTHQEAQKKKYQCCLIWVIAPELVYWWSFQLQWPKYCQWRWGQYIPGFIDDILCLHHNGFWWPRYVSSSHVEVNKIGKWYWGMDNDANMSRNHYRTVASIWLKKSRIVMSSPRGWRTLVWLVMFQSWTQVWNFAQMSPMDHWDGVHW